MKKRLFVVGFSILTTLLFGVFLGRYTSATSQKVVRERANKPESLINPLLDCSESDADFTELRTFRTKLTQLTTDLTNEHDLSYVSVYFRDLNNGPWIGLNEKTAFAPASLLKVPIAMSYYQKAMRVSGLFDEKIIWHDDSENPTTSPLTLEEGQMYTVYELMKRMLIYSDNGAANTLFAGLSRAEALEPYQELGIDASDMASSTFTVRVKDYASFFRVLFNASFLGREASQDMLSILTRSDFNLGLRAGVPESIPIAHKYGLRENSDVTQLHDCGIVYYPEHPYLLCVMTRGLNPDRMATAIADISRLVYHEVDSQLNN